MSIIKCQCDQPAQYVACFFKQKEGKINRQWREYCEACLTSQEMVPIYVLEIKLASEMVKPRARQVIRDLDKIMSTLGAALTDRLGDDEF